MEAPCGALNAVPRVNDKAMEEACSETVHVAQPASQPRTEGEEYEERAADDGAMEDLTNQALYEQLRRQVPNYDWQQRRGRTEDNGNDHYDLVQILNVKERIRYVRRGTQHIQGRGKADVSLKHPQCYLDIVRRMV